MLHTVDYVRSQSSLLFTWILALTAQFDHGSAGIAKRLRLHGERLSRHVYTCGHKSVAIIQGYYISLLSATPAKTLSEERSWLYTMYAFGVAAELGLDQGPRLRPYYSATNPYSSNEDPIHFATPGQESGKNLVANTPLGTSQQRRPWSNERFPRNRAGLQHRELVDASAS